MKTTALYNIWNETIRPLPAARFISDTIWWDLVRRYTEPHRTYHNLDHLQRMFSAVAQLSHHATDLISIHLAIWFHDVIYVPGNSYNEEHSVLYAQNALWQLGVSDVQTSIVEHLIMATKLNQPPTADINEHILRDADLETLGGTFAEYQYFNKAIQAEMADIPEHLTLMGRIRIMEGFLAREHIYFTPEMNALHEKQARRNVARNLNSLRRSALTHTSSQTHAYAA